MTLRKQIIGRDFTDEVILNKMMNLMSTLRANSITHSSMMIFSVKVRVSLIIMHHNPGKINGWAHLQRLK